MQGVDVVVGKGSHWCVLVCFELDILWLTEIAIDAHQSIDGSNPQLSLLVFRDVTNLCIKTIGRVMLKTMLLVIEGQLSVSALRD